MPQQITESSKNAAYLFGQGEHAESCIIAGAGNVTLEEGTRLVGFTATFVMAQELAARDRNLFLIEVGPPATNVRILVVRRRQSRRDRGRSRTIFQLH